MLEKSGANRQAEAELLRESGRASSPELLARVGRGLLTLGSDRAAADVFREVIGASPQAPAGHLGLGEALLAQHDYKAASRAFHDALRADAGNQQAQTQAALCDEVLALDPTIKGLSRTDRFDRSRRLLGAALQARHTCTAAASTPEVEALAAAAQRAVSDARRPRDIGAATESNLDTAVRLWTAMPSTCASPASAAGRVLATIRL